MKSLFCLIKKDKIIQNIIKVYCFKYQYKYSEKIRICEKNWNRNILVEIENWEKLCYNKVINFFETKK